jgi:hypothetical protein
VLNRLQRYFPEAYSFCPKTYVIPPDTKRMAEDMGTGHSHKTYIFKPSAGSQGEGIHLFKT